MIYNLSLDDMTPMFKNFDHLYELIKQAPGIKVTMFVPINKLDFPGDNSLLRNKDWCEELKKLPKENFEISPHGLHHTVAGNRPEFKRLTFKKANALLKICENAFEDMGIEYVKGFRPPMWQISRGTVEALEKRKYIYLADTPRNLRYQEVRHVNIPRIFINDDIYFGNLADEIRLYEKHLPDKKDMLLQRGHLVSRSLNNLFERIGERKFVIGNNFKKVCDTVNSLSNPRFMFLSEIAEVI